jgi:uncharacterized protein (TIGR01777 family)
MNILVTGSHGMVGTELMALLPAQGHDVKRLVRSVNPTAHEGITWDPPRRGPDPEALIGIEAVIHLAGESIAEGRWNAEKKQRILDSRVKGTRLLTEAILKMSAPPKIVISSSAIGFYGNRGTEILREDSTAGVGFLPDVCKQWEAAIQPLAQKGIRVILLRTGIVLSPNGGALAKMLLPFKLGMGGPLGSGQQYMSWIALDDLVGSIVFALQTDSLRGPVNAVSPRPVTNAAYTKALGKVLSRPTIFPVPAFAVRAAFGEMADALLLASTRVEPTQLQNKAYKFRYPELESALRHLLGK